MPVYEYQCDKCDREVTLTLSIRKLETGEIKCPKCGGTSLRPILSAFMSQPNLSVSQVLHDPPPKRIELKTGSACVSP